MASSIHNDDMAIGAVEAIKAAGHQTWRSQDVSVDGTRGGFQAMVDGWLQADVECNPFLARRYDGFALETYERRDRAARGSSPTKAFSTPTRPPNCCRPASTRQQEYTNVHDTSIYCDIHKMTEMRSGVEQRRFSKNFAGSKTALQNRRKANDKGAH